ncbi:NACHT domain-containing protein [Longitalea arenae]|uniref:NACHT domain-containing protein n=1 Tax=Longitalea arenae TaxID=2812558 RepID=UPI001966FDA9|nr:NACHT domain-containing protein [Longitalea arenae]
MKLRKIEILEDNQNKKGDLFGRLMADLFHVLGYDQPRFNINKSGREIDLTAAHRTENKMAIAECKAQAEAIGGADINKFIGVLDAEKKKLKKNKLNRKNDVNGYFISLSGFKETAIEQENDCENKRVILIKPDKLVEELISGRILVPIEKAVASLADLSKGLALQNYYDLLACDNGWIWTLYYSDSNGQETSHFALIHAEGKPLIKSLADGILSRDKTTNKIFDGLRIINKDVSTELLKQHIADARKKYFKYLENELGEIQFEGLPTDKEAGSVKVKLENIFIPLHFIKSPIQMVSNDEEDDDEFVERKGIGNILSNESRLAILAKPGGGKSTLIKRIAIAYAFPDRRDKINDALPEKNWFPIFLRCRDLGEKVTQSITDIINSIPARAEIPACSDGFSKLVSQALQNGTALFLVDGLDEISEDRNRIAFANQLRTFIATYPSLNIIVTSRESGFRAIAGSLASYCQNYTVSNLNGEEIKELSLKWHKAIIDESENTIREANKLNEIILNDARIKALAENPLLLTTLLFVKRWAGYLPTKRSVLYQEMIKLLLVTWNVEGHGILDIDETEPQLAFVAYWMTTEGKQSITADELSNCLIEARTQLPEILGYTKINPSEFIKRVESRSSLLIMAGHKRLDSGNTTPVYEFLHLSFQEYLTAKAIVKKFIPQKDYSKNVIDIIKPHIYRQSWKEVIPLMAVLQERECKELIDFLIAESKANALNRTGRLLRRQLLTALLGSCLANEIQINPETLATAIEWYAKCYLSRQRHNVEIILRNKFATTFKRKVNECFFDNYEDAHATKVGSLISDIYMIELKHAENHEMLMVKILSDLKDGQKEKRCMAILGMMSFAFKYTYDKKENTLRRSEIIHEIFDSMMELVKQDDPQYNLSICWCLLWSIKANLFPRKQNNKLIHLLAKLWVNSEQPNVRRFNSWVLSNILRPTTPKSLISAIPQLEKAIEDRYNKPANDFDRITALFFGIILGIKFDHKEMIDVLNSSVERETSRSVLYFQKHFNTKGSTI